MNLYVFHNNGEFVTYLDAADSQDVIDHITSDKTGQKTSNYITVADGEQPPFPCELSISDNVVTVLTGDALTAAHQAEAARVEMQELRKERNTLLARCDWTQAADSPLGDTDKAAWATYRQQLRDITNLYSSQSTVVWPNKP